MSYDGGESWGPYGGAFNILLEECGIYLSSNQLDPQVWAAIYDDKLRFRITVSIDSDETLEAIICDGPVDCARQVRTVIFDLGNEDASVERIMNHWLWCPGGVLGVSIDSWRKYQ